MAKEISAHHFKASAKTGEGVQGLFQALNRGKKKD